MDCEKQTTTRQKPLTSLSILTKHQVVWVESSSTSNVCPLLTIVGHVKGDTTL